MYRTKMYHTKEDGADRTDVNRKYKRKYICGKKNGIDPRIRKYMRVKSRDYVDIIPAFSYDTARVMNYSVLRRTLAGRG